MIDTTLGVAGTVVVGAAEKVNATGALEALKKPILAALFAVTSQVVAVDALRTFVDVIKQPEPVAEKLNAPEPDPPVAVRVIAVPATPLRTELLIDSGACATGVGTNDAVSVANSKVVEPVPADVTFAGVEVDTREVRIWAGVAAGFFSRRSAAEPATCGEAIDVPLIELVAVVLPIQLERIPDPGAKMSKQVPKLL